MYLFLSIVLILWGLLLFFSPKTWFDLTESWKHSSSCEPSNLWILSTRFGGVMCILVGLAGVIIPIVT